MQRTYHQSPKSTLQHWRVQKKRKEYWFPKCITYEGGIRTSLFNCIKSVANAEGGAFSPPQASDKAAFSQAKIAESAHCTMAMTVFREVDADIPCKWLLSDEDCPSLGFGMEIRFPVGRCTNTHSSVTVYRSCGSSNPPGTPSAIIVGCCFGSPCPVPSRYPWRRQPVAAGQSRRPIQCYMITQCCFYNCQNIQDTCELDHIDCAGEDLFTDAAPRVNEYNSPDKQHNRIQKYFQEFTTDNQAQVRVRVNK